MPYKDPEKRKAYQREYHKRWYAENGDARREQIRAYKQANPEVEAKYRAKPETKALKAAHRRQWRIANRARDNRNRLIWAKQNRERIRKYGYRRDRTEYNRAYYAANRDRLLQMSRIAYLRKRLGISDEQYELMLAFAKRT